MATIQSVANLFMTAHSSGAPSAQVLTCTGLVVDIQMTGTELT
jgi:hypothetical protein